MKIALVGAELEENLALRYIDASLKQSGHCPVIFDFHAPAQMSHLVRDVVAFDPALVGFSMVFTLRAREFVELAGLLREAGYRGHITAGGHFASFNAEQLLGDAPAFDSVLHGEGETGMVDLAAHLDRPESVLGITCRLADGRILTTPRRPAIDDLDALPWPTRPAVCHQYLGLPIANVLSGRGCYGDCHFCSINAWHRRMGGKRFRQRTTASVAGEMASLYHQRGVRIFNFHDDNFFLPDPDESRRRFAELRQHLDRAGVGHIGVQIKARPDSVDATTIASLKQLGLFRVFLGVESNAVAGLRALGRGIRREQNDAAVEILKDMGVHVTFNLLMFEPDCTLGDLADNIDFIRRHQDVPLNFCRVEVYSGTELEHRLRQADRLEGDYFGYTYRIADPRSQLAYEVFRPVFSPRNFPMGALNLQAMSVDYHLHLLKHFFPERVSGRLIRRSKDFIRRLNRNNVALLEEICRFAAEADPDDHAAVEAFSARVGAKRASFDDKMTHEADAVLALIRDRALQAHRQGRLLRTASAAALLVTAAGCWHIYEMAPPESRPAAEEPPAPPRPVVQPYTPEQTQEIQRYLQQKYGPVLDRLVRQHNLEAAPVTLGLELSATGQVRKVSASSPEEAFAKDVEKAAKTWQVPDVPRAGSCTVHLLAGTWHICELAPRDRNEEK